MEYDKKALKIAAKITAATLSESGKLDEETAKKTADFLKSAYKGIAPIREKDDFIKDAFKTAGKITAAAFEEAEDPCGKSAAEFFTIVYDGIGEIALSEDFDEDVFKYAGKITAAACEEMEEPTAEKAAEAAVFFKALYKNLMEEEKPVVNGKYSVKESDAGVSFRLLAGNNQVIGVSEVYSGRAAMEKGIESVRKNAPEAPVDDLTEESEEKISNPKFEVYKDKAGEFRFRLKARNGEVILASEGYKTKASCLNGIESVRKNSPAEIAE